MNLYRKIKGKITSTKIRYGVRGLSPIAECFAFAQAVDAQGLYLKSDIYLAHGMRALTPAQHLAQRHGGRLLADVIEVPSFRERSQDVSWPLWVQNYLDSAVHSQLATCDRFLVPTAAIADLLSIYEKPVAFVPNYRRKSDMELPGTAGALRDRIPLPDGAIPIVSLSTLTCGLEAVLDAFTRLPPEYHLVIVGEIRPQPYHTRMVARMHDLELSDRVHLLPRLNPGEVISVLRDAALGLIVSDLSRDNHRRMLPNRVFDYITAGLPFCSPDIPDIAALHETYGCCRIIETPDGRSWAAGILGAVASLQCLRARTRKAATLMTWEQNEDAMLQAIPPSSSVTILDRKPGPNNRILKMIDLLRPHCSPIRHCIFRNGKLDIDSYG